MKRDGIASDLKRVDALRDEDIDYSDIPELDTDFFRGRGWWFRPASSN